jgi:hypothetical protein
MIFKSKKWLAVCVCISMFASAHLMSQVTGTATPRKAAIFVENRAGPAFNDKVEELEDLLTSRITDKGFSVISREDAINALKTYTTVGIEASSQNAININANHESQNSASVAESGQAKVTESGTANGKVESSSKPPKSASAELAASGAAQIEAAGSAVDKSSGNASASAELAKTDSATIAVTSNTTELDQALSDNSSALRLAQNLGADYLLVASITSFGTKKITDTQLQTVNVVNTLRVSYKVLDGVQAGSLIANTVKATKTTRFTADSQTEDSGLIDDLLDDAATQVAEDAGRKQSTIAAAAVLPNSVEITVSCGMQDLVNMPVSVPDIRVLDDGTVFVSTNNIGMQVLDATVEMDGIAIGSAPGQFKVHPGLSKMRITREGFTPWERTVNCSDGQKFKVALQMSDSGYKRWMETTAFLFGIKTGEKLTDATVTVMQGFAQTLRQSGYRVDSKTDVKADIQEKGKSLFDGATLKVFGQ